MVLADNIYSIEFSRDVEILRFYQSKDMNFRDWFVQLWLIGMCVLSYATNTSITDENTELNIEYWVTNSLARFDKNPTRCSAKMFCEQTVQHILRFLWLKKWLKQVFSEFVHFRSFHYQQYATSYAKNVVEF